MTLVWSLFLTLLLSSLPVPEELQKWFPNWSLLLIVWWTLGENKHSSIFVAWCVGIPLDVLWGTPLGLNGLIFAVVTYLLSLIGPKIKRVNWVRQSIMIFFVLSTGQATSYWARALVTAPVDFEHLIFQAFLTAVAWPLVQLVYDWIDRRLWHFFTTDEP